jgi:hypothetical protein
MTSKHLLALARIVSATKRHPKRKQDYSIPYRTSLGTVSAWISLSSCHLPWSDRDNRRGTMQFWYVSTDSKIKLIPASITVTAEGTAKLVASTRFRRSRDAAIYCHRSRIGIHRHFWSTLLRALGTRHNKTTAIHPQADGQTERVNRIWEDMLRHNVGDYPH